MEPVTVGTPKVIVGLVGGGKGGSALLDLLLDWPIAKVAVVIDRQPDAPALVRARALGIATAAHHLDVFTHPVNLVLEVTGLPEVLDELLRARPPGVEVIGAGGLRFFWDLLQALKGAQEHLVDTQRLRAFGQFASGLVLRFNDLLGAIVGRTQLLLRQESLPADLVRQFEVIEKAALDAARTVYLIQEFTRARSPRPQRPVALGQLLIEVREFTRPRWGKEAQAAGIVYDVRLEAEPVPPVAGDPTELWEALTNLLLNALEAMPGGGRIDLGIAREGDHVRITVRDHGPGMPDDVRRRAFEPFFTTKGQRGTGLGLSIVWSVVQRHGGEITLESSEGSGTTFSLRFPIPPEAMEAPAAVAHALSPRRARILVIDDEPDVRNILRELLEARGHTVAEAADGPSGVALCEAEPFDLVLLDLVMPGMSGWEVAERIEKGRRVPIGLITGWADRIDPAELAAGRFAFVLSKPFQLHEVLQCVAATLAASGDAPSA